MTATRPRFARPACAARSRQCGAVLLVALVVMVAMTLGAIALIRSTDTMNLAIGNLALRQSSILPADMAVEAAAATLFADANRGGSMVADLKADDPNLNYFATYRRDDPDWDNALGVPLPLRTKSAARALKIQLADDAGNDIAYVVERMCAEGHPARPADGDANAKWCDTLAPKPPAGTAVDDPRDVETIRTPFYRVSVRVDGPKNTTSFVQAMLSGRRLSWRVLGQ